jgi:hypothetical protein
MMPLGAFVYCPKKNKKASFDVYMDVAWFIRC